MSFTWIPYYKEFAQRLTQFQKDRKRLLNLIYNYRDELLAKYLHDAECLFAHAETKCKLLIICLLCCWVHLSLAPL